MRKSGMLSFADLAKVVRLCQNCFWQQKVKIFLARPLQPKRRWAFLAVASWNISLGLGWTFPRRSISLWFFVSPRYNSL